MNPVLPIKHFVPDSEARVMPDGRLYVYGSYDISGDLDYCSNELHLFSTDNLIDWQHHGAIFKSSDVPWSNGERLYAPDCIHHDGKYYLYFCMDNNIEGVAISDNPAGPFKNVTAIKHADGDGIDPAIFIDEDARTYYFWGQFHLRAAQMKPDMCTLDENSILTNVIDEKRHGFHEGASIRKRGDTYYLVYSDISRGRATCMSYATSKKPLGPYEKKGIIIDNIGCDPQTWNNHGSICEFKGKWYVFYHRSSGGSKYNRRLCIEPISFDENGLISEVFPTTQGVNPPLPAFGALSAARACRMGGNIRIYPTASGEVLGHIKNGDWAAYRYLNFDSPKTLSISVASALTIDSTIEVWADDEIIGSCNVAPSGAWDVYNDCPCNLKPTYGVKTLYLVFKASSHGRLMEVKTLYFE